MTSESLWRDPDFVRYWASRAVSMLGSAITYVALPVLVYRLTGSATWTGVVTAMDTLPFVFFGLLGGALGDRLDRRALMVGADVVAALAIGSIVVAHLLGHLSIVHLLVAAFVSASAATIFDGANWGALPTLVGRARLPEANAKVYGTVSVFDAAGPAVVGLLLAVVEPGTLLIVGGVIIVMFPLDSIAQLALLAGIWLIIIGLAQVWDALKLHRHLEQLGTPPA